MDKAQFATCDGARSVRSFTRHRSCAGQTPHRRSETMRAKPSKYLAPALLAAAIPATVVLAQQAQPQPAEPQKREWANRPRLSPDSMKRLQPGGLEGRIAEIKEALKLNDAQLKLWAPVEQQLRAGFTARQQAREEFMQRMEQRRQQGGAAERSSLPERLDRISE